MIQIAAAVKGSADFSSTADVPTSGASPAFLALFAQALSSQSTPDSKGTSPLISALLGDNAVAAPAKTGVAADTSVQSSAIDPAGLALLQSLALPAMASVPAQNPATTASLDGGAEQGTVATVIGQTIEQGKKLPSLQAAIAGLQGESVDPSQGQGQIEGLAQSLVQLQGKRQSQGVAQSLAQLQGKQPFQGLAQSMIKGQGQTDVAVQVTAETATQTKPDSQFLDILATKANGNVSAPVVPAQNDTAAPDAGSQVVAQPPLPGQEALVLADKGASVAQAAPHTPTVVNMQASFGSAAWPQDLGDKVTWMAANQGHISQLVLNPPNLGTVEVRLHLNGNEAGAQFFSANADVRQAIEAAMPKLREMMAGAGIALGQAMVSNQSFSQRDANQQQPQSAPQAGGANTMTLVSGVGPDISIAAAGVGGNSLLDYYA